VCRLPPAPGSFSSPGPCWAAGRQLGGGDDGDLHHSGFDRLSAAPGWQGSLTLDQQGAYLPGRNKCSQDVEPSQQPGVGQETERGTSKKNAGDFKQARTRLSRVAYPECPGPAAPTAASRRCCHQEASSRISKAGKPGDIQAYKRSGSGAHRRKQEHDRGQRVAA